MILWKKYKVSLNQFIIEKVGMKERSNISNTFLIMAGFLYENKDKIKTEPQLAYIIKHEDGSLKIQAWGLSGTIIITHWTELNRPTKIK